MCWTWLLSLPSSHFLVVAAVAATHARDVKLVCTGPADSKEELRRRGYPATTSLMSPIPSRETLFGSLSIYFSAYC